MNLLGAGSGAALIVSSLVKVSLLGESQLVRRLHFVIHVRSLILLPQYPLPCSLFCSSEDSVAPSELKSADWGIRDDRAVVAGKFQHQSWFWVER